MQKAHQADKVRKEVSRGPRDYILCPGQFPAKGQADCSNRAWKSDRVSFRAIAKDRLSRRLIMASITQSFRNLGRVVRNSSFNLLLAYEATCFTPTYFRSL